MNVYRKTDLSSQGRESSTHDRDFELLLERVYLSTPEMHLKEQTMTEVVRHTDVDMRARYYQNEKTLCLQDECINAGYNSGVRTQRRISLEVRYPYGAS